MNANKPKKTDKAAHGGLTPEDFYTNEQGFMVFTEAHHRKRGYCCKNGCLHCPYGFKKMGDT